MRLVAISAAAILLCALSASAQDLQKEVEAVDAKRVEALKNADGNAWAETIADTCVWVVMGTGEVEENKTERMATISASGGIDNSANTDEKWHVTGTRAVHTGNSSILGRFVRVYTKNSGAWRMVFLAAERFPAN